MQNDRSLRFVHCHPFSNILGTQIKMQDLDYNGNERMPDILIIVRRFRSNTIQEQKSASYMISSAIHSPIVLSVSPCATIITCCR